MSGIIKILFDSSRPISWVNTAYPFALGYLLMGGSVDARFIIGSLFFLIPYNLLMYGINDVFDYESDIKNPRKGGVEGAITPKRYHRAIIMSSIGLSVPFVAALVVLGSWVSAAVLAVVLFFVVAYSAPGLRFKEIPFLDSVTSSMHFVGPLLYAFSLVGSTPAGWIAAIAFFTWGIASQAFGAVQDIKPDREAGIGSVGTVIGARRTVRFATVLYAIAALLTSGIGGLAWIVALAGLLYVVNIAVFWNITDSTSATARAGWRRFLWINYVTGAIVTIVCLAATVY